MPVDRLDYFDETDRDDEPGTGSGD